MAPLLVVAVRVIVMPMVLVGIYFILACLVFVHCSGLWQLAKLTLGDAQKGLLIPFGSYYNDTGGTWVFVLSPDGRSAERREVKLGRKNPDFIEVLSGLQAGERILTSSYAGFTDKARLDLDRPAT